MRKMVMEMMVENREVVVEFEEEEDGDVVDL